MKLSEELTWRGFVNQTTFKDITDLDLQKRTFYFGVDPSASSMTIGNLAAAMMVKVLIKHGYTPILLVGGATGLIGDPDGKKQERELLTTEQISENKQSIAEQYKTLFSGQEFEIVDNYDWFKDIGYLDFLRDIGKNLSMTQLLDREFVKNRIGKDGAGISYAEFSYSLIQGYDFLHLFRNNDVTLQVCGADQWGNSLAGVEMIRKLEGKEAHVYSVPLIVNKTTGVKFGKSEDGAVWLDPMLTSAFKFYQFWLNLDDEGVGEYIKIYTSITPEEYDELMKEFEVNRASRSAQKYLAYEVTKLIHGEKRAESVKRVSDVLFGAGSFAELSNDNIEELATEIPVVQSKDIISALVESKLTQSNSEARRFIESGAISINGEKVTLGTELKTISLNNGYLLLKKGKNSVGLIKSV